MDVRRELSGLEVNPTSEELNLMPSSNREGISGISNGLSNNVNHIISGINAVINPGTDATVVSGFVYLNGEVLKVDGQTVVNTTATDNYVFQLSVTDGASPDWDRVFKDGFTKNVYEVRRAIVVNVVTPGGFDLLINGTTLGQAITPTLTGANPSVPGLMSGPDKTKLDSIDPEEIRIITGVITFSGTFVSKILTPSGGFSAAVFVAGSSGFNSIIDITFPVISTNNFFTQYEIDLKESTNNSFDKIIVSVFSKTTTTMRVYVNTNIQVDPDFDIFFSLVKK